MLSERQQKLVEATFPVDTRTHLYTGWVHRCPRFWRVLGNLETRIYAEQLEGIHIRQPLFVAGLARSGSTILLELLAAHPEVGTHRYRDYPPLHTPLWTDHLLQRIPRPALAQAERAHGDGILVTPESPEAFEEVLWMAWRPHLHAPGHCEVLGREESHPQFEQYYRDHLRKILLVRGRSRYASKGNYNLSRLAYLQKLFPDGRFLIPVRAPREHVASLRKQQFLFSQGERQFPRALAHMQRVGHYEFGLDRRPIQLNHDEAEARSVRELWAAGQEVRGWARYWAQVHTWLHNQLQADSQLAAAVRLVRYEDLCAAPGPELRAILAHCQLPDSAELVDDFARRITQPTYYRPQFTPEDEAAIQEETAVAGALFGYG